MTREIIETDEFRQDQQAPLGDFTLTLLGQDGVRRDVEVSGVSLEDAYRSAPDYCSPYETLLSVTPVVR